MRNKQNITKIIYLNKYTKGKSEAQIIEDFWKIKIDEFLFSNLREYVKIT